MPPAQQETAAVVNEGRRPLVPEASAASSSTDVDAGDSSVNGGNANADGARNSVAMVRQLERGKGKAALLCPFESLRGAQRPPSPSRWLRRSRAVLSTALAPLPAPLQGNKKLTAAQSGPSGAWGARQPPPPRRPPARPPMAPAGGSYPSSIAAAGAERGKTAEGRDADSGGPRHGPWCAVPSIHASAPAKTAGPLLEPDPL